MPRKNNTTTLRLFTCTNANTTHVAIQISLILMFFYVLLSFTRVSNDTILQADDCFCCYGYGRNALYNYWNHQITVFLALHKCLGYHLVAVCAIQVVGFSVGEKRNMKDCAVACWWSVTGLWLLPLNFPLARILFLTGCTVGTSPMSFIVNIHFTYLCLL